MNRYYTNEQQHAHSKTEKLMEPEPRFVITYAYATLN